MARLLHEWNDNCCGYAGNDHHEVRDQRQYDAAFECERRTLLG
jgi:hypothetical protein